MNPSGSASAKKRRPAAVSDSPAHPRIVAPAPFGSCGDGCSLGGSGCEHDATDTACLDIALVHVRHGLLPPRPRPDPVVDAAAAEGAALDLPFHTAQHLPLDLAPPLTS